MFDFLLCFYAKIRSGYGVVCKDFCYLIKDISLLRSTLISGRLSRIIDTVCMLNRIIRAILSGCLYVCYM